MQAHSNYVHFSHHTPTVMRWLRLIEIYGGHTAALEALLRDSENLEHLMQGMRSCGIDPYLLIKEAELMEAGNECMRRAG